MFWGVILWCLREKIFISEAYSDIEEYFDALGVLVFVGVLVAYVFFGIETSLLVCVGDDVAVVENVVDVEVEIERNFAVDVYELAYGDVEAEGVFQLVLCG